MRSVSDFTHSPDFEITVSDMKEQLTVAAVAIFADAIDTKNATAKLIFLIILIFPKATRRRVTPPAELLSLFEK